MKPRLLVVAVVGANGPEGIPPLMQRVPRQFPPPTFTTCLLLLYLARLCIEFMAWRRILWGISLIFPFGNDPGRLCAQLLLSDPVI